MLVLDKLKLTRRQREDAKAASFEDLARRLANNENVSETAIDETLAASGHDVSELETAVDAWKKRFAISPLLAEEARLRQELPTTHDALPALETELAELTERVRLTRQAAINRQTTLNQRLRAIHEQKRQLESECRDHAALGQLKAAREKLANVSPWLQNLRSGLRDVENTLNEKRAEIAAIDARADSGGHAIERRSALDQAVRGLENDARELRRKIDKLAADEAVALKDVADAESVVFATK